MTNSTGNTTAEDTNATTLSKSRQKKNSMDDNQENIEPENRFYFDETGSCINMTPTYGRSLQDQPAYEEKPTYPSDTISTLPVLTEEGIKA